VGAEWWVKLLLGAAGGAAPEILRFYRIRTGSTPSELKRAFYWGTVGAFLLLAGLLAFIIASNAATSFATGVGTPFLVKGMERSASEQGEDRQGPRPRIEEVTVKQPTHYQRVRLYIRSL